MAAQDNRAKVLCVEDDYDQRRLLSFLLQRDGLNVRTAADGREGVSIALEWSPDLILMDLMMPVMDGFEATRALRANDETRATPILALTAFGEEPIRQRAQAVGMDGFMMKTILPAGLLDTLSQYLPSISRRPARAYLRA